MDGYRSTQMKLIPATTHTHDIGSSEVLMAWNRATEASTWNSSEQRNSVVLIYRPMEGRKLLAYWIKLSSSQYQLSADLHWSIVLCSRCSSSFQRHLFMLCHGSVVHQRHRRTSASSSHLTADMRCVFVRSTTAIVGVPRS